MKKIGILTLPYKFNYGAFLQTYFLSNHLIQLGYDVKVIDYQNIRYSIIEKIIYFITQPKVFFDYLKNRKIIKNYLPLTNRFFFLTQKKLDCFDYILYGSDELWNLNRISIGFDKNYFGAIPSKNHKKIGYSCSFGNTTIYHKKINKLNKLISNFDQVSVRDLNSQNILKKNFRINSIITVDPVLLNGSEGEILQKPLIKDKYILIYLKKNRPFKNQILNFAIKNNLMIISIGFNCEFSSKNITERNPFIFLNLIKFSNVIVSDMFHGLQFSIKFKKKLFLISNMEKKLKVAYLQKILSLKYISSELNFSENKINDFNDKILQRLILKEIKISETYLKRTLN